MFVLDASVTLAWCFEDEKTPYSENVLDTLEKTQAVVPALWQLEVANVLLVGERRQRLTQAQTTRFIELLEGLPIETTDAPQKLSSTLGLGRAYSLSAYDAAYLDLAAGLGLPLATLGAPLRTAANRMGVTLLEV